MASATFTLLLPNSRGLEGSDTVFLGTLLQGADTGSEADPRGSLGRIPVEGALLGGCEPGQLPVLHHDIPVDEHGVHLVAVGLEDKRRG